MGGTQRLKQGLDHCQQVTIPRILVVLLWLVPVYKLKSAYQPIYPSQKKCIIEGFWGILVKCSYVRLLCFCWMLCICLFDCSFLFLGKLFVLIVWVLFCFRIILSWSIISCRTFARWKIPHTGCEISTWPGLIFFSKQETLVQTSNLFNYTTVLRSWGRGCFEVFRSWTMRQASGGATALCRTGQSSRGPSLYKMMIWYHDNGQLTSVNRNKCIKIGWGQPLCFPWLWSKTVSPRKQSIAENVLPLHWIWGSSL